ncbi:MAG: FAD-dependent oxidoreductase [Saccharofermentanales bacterium]
MLKSKSRISVNKQEPGTPHYDIVIIGGGVIGSLISYQLSKYELSICLLEKRCDLAMEESGANSAIVHAGYDPEPGSGKALFNVRGNKMMEPLCRSLHVPFKRNGSLIIAFSEEERKTLDRLFERGSINGVEGLELLDRDSVLAMEPALSSEVTGALHAPTGGIVCPYELTHAASEVAFQNGVAYYFNHAVTAIRPITASSGTEPGKQLPDGRFEVECGEAGAKFTCDIIINAAGVFADRISGMAGDGFYKITPRRGEYVILDKTIGDKVGHTIFQTPSSKGKGVLVTPTVDGNILVGPNSQEIDDCSDCSTTDAGINEIWDMAVKSVPSLEKKWIIRTFAGIRSTPSTHDFIIGESTVVPGFFEAAGIESPGLTAAPAIAVEIERLVTESFKVLPKVKKTYIIDRSPVIRFRDLPMDEQRKRIRENPLYAHVVCRCEKITEAEVVAAIRGPLGARTVNGVKARTRAGMGRCQSGFCLPKIIAILAREMNVPEESITLSGPGSEMLVGKTRCI